MFGCDIKEVCNGLVGTFVLNLFGVDEAKSADVGVCIPCLRAEWKRGGGLHKAVDRLLIRYANQQAAAEAAAEEQADLDRERREIEGTDPRTLREEIDDIGAAEAWEEQRSR